jgi:predicted transcriptional regulator
MTTDDYKTARTDLNMTVSEWIEKLGISIDTHKSYNSGRNDISPQIANHIQTLLELDRIKKGVLNTLK